MAAKLALSRSKIQEKSFRQKTLDSLIVKNLVFLAGLLVILKKEQEQRM